MIIYDPLNGYTHPNVMDEPREDQCQGTALEKLCETAGRICYDSYGKGRSSLDYHQHIKDVGHLSVYEHANVTVRLDLGYWSLDSVLQQLINRPGIWVVIENGYLYVTLNYRCILEWSNWAPCSTLYGSLWNAMREIAPQILPEEVGLASGIGVSVVQGRHPEQFWISVVMSGVSRGLSHEQVRHGDRTAISQRSTRYVDERSSRWIYHPLLLDYLVETNDSELASKCHGVIINSRNTYVLIHETLFYWLLNKGVDGATALKQSRGAARGFLGNALETELVFSASYAQWLRMKKQRLSPFADAEIRHLYERIMPDIERIWNEA